MQEKPTVVQPPAPPVSPLLEYIRFGEFKRLLGHLSETMDKSGVKSIAVLSELPGEGKTFLASALALGFSTLLQKRVLVLNTTDQPQGKELRLDTVFRKPNANRKDKSERGIDLISPHDDGAMPAESTDFQLGEYIRSVRDRYDVIIADTCALSVTNKNNIDPVVISRHSDASILITSRRSLERETAAASRERIRQWNVKLLGIIHNEGPSA